MKKETAMTMWRGVLICIPSCQCCKRDVHLRARPLLRLSLPLIRPQCSTSAYVTRALYTPHASSYCASSFQRRGRTVLGWSLWEGHRSSSDLSMRKSSTCCTALSQYSRSTIRKISDRSPRNFLYSLAPFPESTLCHWARPRYFANRHLRSVT